MNHELLVNSPMFCAGEAQYTDDIPPYPNELYGAFVTSSVGNCLIDSIDASRALVIYTSHFT